MNERIRQLAEQAGLRFTQLMSNPMVPVVDGKETDLEKFAELIVQECADIVEQAKKSPFVSLDDAKRMSHFVDVTKKKITKHFGVDE